MTRETPQRTIGGVSLLRLLIILLLILHLSSCGDKHIDRSGDTGQPTSREWSAILKSDTLRVGTITSPIGFYIYRGEPLGHEYRKALAFAKEHGLELDVQIATHEDSLKQWLSDGRIDLSITPIAMTRSHTHSYRFCGVVDTIALHLVQKRQLGEPLIRRESIKSLNGAQVYVLDRSTEALRMEQIKQEMGMNELQIIPVDTLDTEDLLRMVATVDTIRYTVADERIARLYAQHYPHIDAATRVSVPIRYAWMTTTESDSLAMEVDLYFSNPATLEHFGRLLDHELQSSPFFRSSLPGRRNTGHPMLLDGSLSPYDYLFEREAERLGWPWTYLAAIAYQESRFDSSVIGWSGARGLMGIMPATGRAYGATTSELLDPATSVRVSVDCLIEIRKSFRSNPSNTEQIHFTLASYNAGIGHVMDAIRLAEKYGARTDIWHGGVREYLLLKSSPKYYNDPVVRNGYVRGTETAKYVDEVMQRQTLYTNITQGKSQL